MSGRLAAGLGFVQLNNGLWRITRGDGSVLGYVEAPTDDTVGTSGGSYIAKRLAPSRRAFHAVGEFRSFREALECLRFA